MFSWASWCCWYSKTRNFCITSSQDLIYSKKNEGNLKKLPKSAKNWPHMSNFPQLFGQNSTILWSRHVVLMSMKLTMSKKRVFLMYSDHKVIYSAKTHLRIKWTSSFFFNLFFNFFSNLFSNLFFNNLYTWT